MTITEDDITDIIKNKIDNLRPKLLDLSRRNPLIATRLGPRTSSNIRVVDELPDVLFYKLNNDQEMRFVPLPAIDDDPKDEQTDEFRNALTNARLVDETYSEELDAVKRDAADNLDQIRAIERDLKDRVREQLEMPKRTTKSDMNLAQHARNNGITPSYDLPTPDDEHEDGRHTDDDIQTLLLPNDLERKLNSITSKCRTWIQETGINVLQMAFGFVEWSEPGQTDSSFAPLLLSQAKIEKKRTSEGVEFWISGLGEEPEINAVFAEKLRLEFSIELPEFDGGSIEDYLVAIADLAPRNLNWRVRRQVAMGVFPSARMAMYHDLDTTRPGTLENVIVGSLLAGANSDISTPYADEYEVDQPEIERCVPCLVMDADSSQFSTLVDVAKGKNLAVEGPPGTGKSQTIVNAIAAALSEGKKVLFVAEKLAALNVVRSRLEAVGLSEFLLPLQAERSSREQVIDSIRQRVEMDRTGAVRDFESRLAEYRRTRDALATYISLVTRPFKDSGFTIHEILGKSIATNPRLQSLPVEVVERCSIPDDLQCVSGFARLRELGEQIERAYRESARAQDHWKSTGLTHVDRFTAEEVCSLATRASQAFKELAEAQKQLAGVGIRADQESGSLEEIDESLETAATLVGKVQVATLSQLLKQEIADHIRQFLDRCDNCQTGRRRLKEVLAVEITPEAIHVVEAVSEICSRAEFDTLDLKRLTEGLNTKRKALKLSQDIRATITPLVDVRPDSATWPFTYMAKAHALVKDAGREALLCRTPQTSEPSAPQILAALCREGQELRETKAKLEKTVSFAVEVTSDALSNCIATLRASGPFSFLSAQYRQAKRLCRSLSRSDLYHKGESVEMLEELLTFRKNEKDFSQNPQALALFGIHFRGIDTDFELFERLAGFYKLADSSLRGPNSKAIRSFLRDADVEELDLIPEIPTGITATNFENFCEEINSAQTKITEYGAAMEDLSSHLALFEDPAATAAKNLPEIAANMRVIVSERAALDCETKALAVLGDHFRGWQTQSDILRPAVVWGFASTRHAEEISQVLFSGRIEEARSYIPGVVEKSRHADEALSALCKAAKIESIHFAGGRSSQEIADFLSGAGDDVDGLFAHSAFGSRTEALQETGVMPLVEFRLDSSMGLESTADQFEALAVRQMARSAYLPELSKFSGSRLDELRSKLAEKDREIIRLSRQQLRFKVQASANPPFGNGVGRKSTWTEMALIENEISKTRRFVSVRDLTHRSGRALQELKPCWMMSPLAVAQYAPREKLVFDLCIIDEASQMPPEAAVGALLRCKQTVVVGDTNQLPPSSFFKKMIDEEDADEDETVLNESILEMANASFRPPRRLRWHYRSRHSGLIKFSNRLVYDDDLIVFPSATEAMSRMGVQFRAIGGSYKSGTNAAEAKAMVDAILAFMRSDRGRSLGVVTLNQKQRDLISEEFEYAIRSDRGALEYIEEWKNKNDGLEEFFIKNLENVQGDERDVIFIGTVYGPEQPGSKVMQRFGPINGIAGKRRLNVLFSRAKEKIVTFSSMSAADITADEHGNAGAYMLKRWLEYSATGMLESGTETSRETDSDFEDFVVSQIKAMGCEPVPQVGVVGYFIDIGVKHPDWPHGFVLGVECDGATYHSAKSARDRDRLRQEVLEGLGWKLHRIWSTDWFNNPQREAEKLRAAISARVRELKAREKEFLRPTVASVPPPKVGMQEEQAKKQSIQEQDSKKQPDRLTPKRKIETRTEPDVAEDITSGISVGDTVLVRYLGDDQKKLHITISEAASNPTKGIIHFRAPIAKALLGAEEGDEVEVLVGSYVRPAIVESIERPSD